MEPDIILCDVLSTELGIDPTRVVVYNQNFVAPSDQNAYITVAYQSSRIVGSSNVFDPDTDEEVKSVTINESYNVEITSKNRTALSLYPGVITALTSEYSIRQQEDNNIRFSRTRDVQDLSFIEGASALHRMRIPVIVDRLVTRRTAITPIDKFPQPEVVEDGP